jgi:hypothetical protein
VYPLPNRWHLRVSLRRISACVSLHHHHFIYYTLHLINSGISEPVASDGYIATADITVMAQCQPAVACRAGLKSSVSNRPGTNSSSQFCSDGYVGVTCATCDMRYYRLNKLCTQCPTTPVFEIVAFVIGSIVGLALIGYTMYRFGIIKWLDSLYKKFDQKLLSMSITLMQTLGMLQVIQLKWTKEVKTTMSVVSLANFNIEFMAPECQVPISFEMRLYLVQLSPIIFILFVDVLYM